MVDRKTRGRTKSGRLRALDAFVVQLETGLLRNGQGPFIDLGFGHEPATTLEAAETFRALSPELNVVGLEREPERVLSAKAHEDDRTRFIEGGFADLAAHGPARLIRVMNVLRGYREEEVPEAHAQIGAALEEGGLGLEGSADPSGGLLTCHLLRRRNGELEREGLLFFSAFEHGFAPMQFRDWLPRDLRRRVRPGEPIHTFLQTWNQAWEATRSQANHAAQNFEGSVLELAKRTEEVEAVPGLVQSGYCLWRPTRAPR